MNGAFKIYALFDPREPDIIRYVGATGYDLNERLSNHFGFDRKKKTVNRKEQWLIGLAESGIRPQIKLLETCDEFEVERKERQWIKHYGHSGKLLNDTKDRVYTSTVQFGHRLSREQIETEIQLRKARQFQEKHCPETLPKMELSDSPLRYTESLNQTKLAMAEIERRMNNHS